MRQRPCGQIAVPTPTARAGSSSVILAIGPDSQSLALLDMQLDVAPDPRKSLRVGTEPVRVAPGDPPGAGQADAVAVPEAPGAVSVQGAGEDARPRARHPEPRAFLVDEVCDPYWDCRLKTPVPQGIHRGEGTDNSERPVVSAAARHGV